MISYISGVVIGLFVLILCVLVVSGSAQVAFKIEPVAYSQCVYLPEHQLSIRIVKYKDKSIWNFWNDTEVYQVDSCPDTNKAS